MATDALVQLQASVTKTATFNGASVNIPGGTPVHGIRVRVIYSAATNVSGSNAVVFSVDVSPDNSTWNTGEFQAVDKTVNLSTTAQSGEFEMVVSTTQPYIRLSATFSGAGSTPTITYQGDIELN